MQDDDLLRNALRDFAYSEPTPAEYAAARRDAERAESRRRAVQWLTAAAIAIVIAGAVAWIARARPPAVPPTEPTPSPTPTSSPRPSASPSPPPTPPGGYAVQTRAGSDFPHGGLGETVEGITLTDIDITDAECPGSTRCPGVGRLTIENSTTRAIDAFVYFNVFRNNTPAVGKAARITLAPGESTSVTIDVQPELADSVPPGQTGSLFSWNFSVEPA